MHSYARTIVLEMQWPNFSILYLHGKNERDEGGQDSYLVFVGVLNPRYTVLFKCTHTFHTLLMQASLQAHFKLFDLRLIHEWYVMSRSTLYRLLQNDQSLVSEAVFSFSMFTTTPVDLKTHTHKVIKKCNSVNFWFDQCHRTLSNRTVLNSFDGFRLPC